MSTSTKKKITAIPYVSKEKYVQVTLEGEPFSLDSSHPTFAKLAKALKAKNWKVIPRLVTLARSMVSASHGKVSVKNGVVLYKDEPIDDSLSHAIIEMVKGKKDFIHMLRFMDDLYKNPSREAQTEFFDWFKRADLPVTDDGNFLCYKSVDGNLKDQYTHTIDNSPGQVIMMPRAAADLNYRTQCSYGFHVCSRHYGTYGSRVLAVKVRPQDVISAPPGEIGKMRVLRYEVIKELGTMNNSELFKANGYAALEKQLVVEISKERKELLQMLLDSAIIKRLIRQKKIKKSTLQKYPYGRLKTLAERNEVFSQVQQAPSVDGTPYLQAARKAAGLTVGQVAKQMGISYKVVGLLEKKEEPEQKKSDAFLTAIGALKGIRDMKRSAVSYPTPTTSR